MKDDYKIKNSKIISLIVISGILGLIVLSFLPLISEKISSDNLDDFYDIVSPSIINYYEENPNETVNTTMYYTLGTLKQRDNGNIENIYIKTVLIQICYWGLILFGITGFIGYTLDISKKFSKISNILLLTGSITLIASILLLYFYFDIILITLNIDNISMASIHTEKTPFKYLYFTMILGLCSLIGSSIYTNRVVSFILKQRRKKHKIVENQQKEKIEEIKTKKPSLAKDETPLYEIELLSELETKELNTDQYRQDLEIQKNIEKQEKLDKIREEFKKDSQETIQKIPIEEIKEEKINKTEETPAEKPKIDEAKPQDEITEAEEEIEIKYEEKETEKYDKESSDHFVSKKDIIQPEKTNYPSSQQSQISDIKSFDEVLSLAIEKKKKEREKKN